MDADGAYTQGAIALSVILKLKGGQDHEGMLRALVNLEETAYAEALQ